MSRRCPYAESLELLREYERVAGNRLDDIDYDGLIGLHKRVKELLAKLEGKP